MTAIAGLVHDDRVYIGGDSAATGYSFQTIRADPKVFRTGPYTFGFTSSFRMGDLLRYAFIPPAPSVDLDRFLRTTFIDAVRTVLKDGGYASKNNETEGGGTFLVGVKGRLFQIAGDYQVGESIDQFDAVGSGREPALGALLATSGLGLPPKPRLTLALQSAARYNSDVAGPFTICSTK